MATSGVATTASRSFADAAARNQHLYRLAMRSAPRIIQMYDLPYNVGQVRSRIAQEFRKHQNVRDPVTMDMLWFKGKSELDETLMTWKQRPHILHYFAPQKKEESDFLRKFYANEDID
jgi:hypothetical protein